MRHSTRPSECVFSVSCSGLPTPSWQKWSSLPMLPHCRSVGASATSFSALMTSESKAPIHTVFLPFSRDVHSAGKGKQRSDSPHRASQFPDSLCWPGEVGEWGPAGPPHSTLYHIMMTGRGGGSVLRCALLTQGRGGGIHTASTSHSIILPC